MAAPLSNRWFRLVMLGSLVVLVGGLLGLGLLMVTGGKSDTARSDVGVGLLTGAATSAAFFLVGWIVDRSAARRHDAARAVNAIAADLVQLRDAAELARFHIAVDHSARTYRDRVAPLIGGVGLVEQAIELLAHSAPLVDGAGEIKKGLSAVQSDLVAIRDECRCHYHLPEHAAPEKERGVSAGRADELPELEELNTALGISWLTAGKGDVTEPPPLIAKVNHTLGLLRRPTRRRRL
jgi:hypothetical protein